MYDPLTLAETGRLFADFGQPAVDESRGSAFLVSNNQIVEVDGSSASIVNAFADTAHPTAQVTRLAVGEFDRPGVFFVSQTRRNTSGGPRVAEFLTSIDPVTDQIVDSIQYQAGRPQRRRGARDCMSTRWPVALSFGRAARRSTSGHCQDLP